MYIKYARTLILLSLKLHCKYGFRFNSYLIVSIFLPEEVNSSQRNEGGLLFMIVLLLTWKAFGIS